MPRTLATLMTRVREELQAEGPNGGGYSDFAIREHINAAIAELSGVYPIRDTIEFQAEEGKNQYSLQEFLTSKLENIIKVEYNGRALTPINVDAFTRTRVRDEGQVDKYFLWGQTLTLIGEVEDVPVTVFITRAPTRLENPEDEPEFPYYFDEAIVQYAITACYREAKRYERASFHFNIYLTKLNNLRTRAIPQAQRDMPARMRDVYWPPVGNLSRRKRSDTNPGGN